MLHPASVADEGRAEDRLVFHLRRVTLPARVRGRRARRPERTDLQGLLGLRRRPSRQLSVHETGGPMEIDGRRPIVEAFDREMSPAGRAVASYERR
jgi:hypothetical protein